MSLARELADRLNGSVVIVGIGNPLRGDDAAGCELARRLQDRSRARVINAEEIPESYLFEIARDRPDTVLLVDAVDMAAAPGCVAVIEADELARYSPSTHRVPLGLLMECLRRESAADVFLLAVQPKRIGLAEPMSPEVEASSARLAVLLENLLPADAAGVGSAAAPEEET